jgi:hypothetical protein
LRHELEIFELDRVHRTRKSEIYDPPVVLLRKSPSTQEHAPAAMLALERVAYRESYIGYSCASVAEPRRMATYIWALMNSRLFLYYALMTSSIFGCEREAMQKADIEQFPVFPLDSLSAKYSAQLDELVAKAEARQFDMRDIDEMVNGIYGLTPADVTLVEDRLTTALPFSRVLRAAAAPPRETEVDQYQEALVSILQPFDMSDRPLEITNYRPSALSPW